MEIIQALASGSTIHPISSSSRLRPHHQYHHHHYSRIPILPLRPSGATPSFGSIKFVTCAVLDNTTSSDSSLSTNVAQVVDDQSLAIKKRASGVSSDLKGASIFLVGINSSYKSNMGKILADALRYYYFDSDSLVEEAAGGKAAALSYIESDEAGYLASETEVLKQLSSMGRLVVSAGNGAVKSTENLALLRHGISIWIDVPLDLVARDMVEERIQVSASDARIYKSSPEVLDQLIALYESGRSGYSTADATISLQKVASNLGHYELDAVTAEDLCLEVLKEIERLMRVKKMMEEAARPF